MSEERKGGVSMPPADIVSVGMVTPVGLSAEASAAAIAAGRNQGQKSSFVNRVPAPPDREHLDRRNVNAEIAPS